MSALMIPEVSTQLPAREVVRYKHYALLSAPYKPALCGKPAPARGWWADALQEAKEVLNTWQTCPACQSAHEGLFIGGGRK